MYISRVLLVISVGIALIGCGGGDSPEGVVVPNPVGNPTPPVSQAVPNPVGNSTPPVSQADSNPVGNPTPPVSQADSNPVGNPTPPVSQADPDPVVIQVASKLEKAQFFLSGGFVSEDYVIKLDDGDVTTLATISSKPSGSTALLAVESPGVKFKFTPDIAGEYEVTFTQGGTTRVVRLSAKSTIPFNTADLIPGTGRTASTGVLTNQFVFYSSLSLDAAKKLLIDKYPELSLIGVAGPLFFIRVSRDSDAQIASFERLKSATEFEYFGNRIIQDAPIPLYTPNDGSIFGDNGDNWHLEKIRAEAAWDISRGSPDVSIGVMDGSVDADHPEIKSRLNTINQPFIEFGSADHGTAVVSAIVGVENNQKGIAGINHNSRVNFISYNVDGGRSNFEKYSDTCKGSRVANHSWSSISWLMEERDPLTGNLIGDSDIEIRTRNWNSGNTTALLNSIFTTHETYSFWKAYDHFRPARAFAKSVNGNSCLSVIAAGNEGVNAKYNNGSIHYFSRATSKDFIQFDPLSNVILVAALRRNGNLADYSNFGESVDIAAPTEYKTAAADNKYYIEDDNTKYGKGGGFGGTSASAPVVTGVASLIFSKYPQFDAATVKKILVKSATLFATHRDRPCINSGECGAEVLPKPIPILDAKASLDLAARIASPPTVHFTVTPASPKAGDVVVLSPYVTTPAGKRIASYTWTHGDGSTHTSSSNFPSQVVYQTDGVYKVELVAVDDAGGSNSYSTLISVAPKSSSLTPSLSINFGSNSRDLLGAQNFQAVQFIPGREGRHAAKFGGVSNPGYIRIPNQAAMQFTDSASFDMWVRIDSMIGMDGWGTTVSNGAYAMTLLSKSHDRRGVAFMATATTDPNAKIWTQSFDPSMAGNCTHFPLAPIPLGTWVRVTYTMSSTNGIRGYFNKTPSFQCPTARPNFSAMNAEDLYIGKFSDVWYPLDGAIQDIRIYQKALTDTEVFSLN